MCARNMVFRVLKNHVFVGPAFAALHHAGSSQNPHGRAFFSLKTCIVAMHLQVLGVSVCEELKVDASFTSLGQASR